MSADLPPHFIDLVQEAALRSFWTKPALKTFLRRSHVSETFLAQLDVNETKRVWLNRLFPQLEATERGQSLIKHMARSLAEQQSFPDLSSWEDSAEKIRVAKAAVLALRRYVEQMDEEQESEVQAADARKRGAELRERNLQSQMDLTKLRARLDEMVKRLGTQQAGYDFQTWFYDLMEYFEVDNRRPYTGPSGRQIDGSITIEGTTYLVELKFTTSQSGATDIDSLEGKLKDKADNTMAVFVSMSGFTSVALSEASCDKTPHLLFDYSHLYLVLSGGMTFADMIKRVRRHSSQVGEAFLAVERFGGNPA